MQADLHLHNIWQYEVEAMLSQMGCVTNPPELIAKSSVGASFNEEDIKMLGTYTQVSANLVMNIPRLEDISQMIEKQAMTYQEFLSSGEDSNESIISLGAQMLRAANDFDRFLVGGEIKKMLSRS